ncbi:phage tail tape measure protein [Microvirga sp. CF3062]|uniref:phage tail tape measure protein n=1 Tax=Microvirga sp. CF3062 TaxID=3110182 RepID=UPI002E7885F6|nr:phage tail tape measure protein [Microvirga sp. CF3062]MEE1656489.1 phage tail tape measure protein [Microvirga sp. CF3062]
MNGRSMAVSVVVRLKDMFSSGIGGLINRLRSLSNMGGRLKALGSSIGKFGREVGVLGGALAALSFAAPLQSAAAFDSQLRDIAITAGRTGAAVELSIAEQAKRYQKLALEVGQRSRDLAAGGQLLVAAGMEQGLIDRLMPTIGRISTAANAAVADVSQTAFALNDALKIKPDQMELALAKLVTAGKLGRFEFKNMAGEFPELTQQMAALGVTGMEAVESLGAALQIAMKGTSDPKAAANNLKNFLSKMASPEAKKNFADMGVDIAKVMQDATAKGINPMEAVVEKINRLTGVSRKEVDGIIRKAKAGGANDAEALDQVRQRIEQVTRGTKIGELFQDQQVIGFLLPMLANLEKYQDLKGEINRSTLKVVDDDFASRMAGLEKKLERFAEIGDQAMRRVGLAFATNLPWMMQTLEAVLAGVAWVDQNFPGAIDGFLSLAGGALLLAGGLGVLGPVFSILGAGFGIITSALGVLGGVIAAIFSPIGILVALLVGAAAIIITNWSTFAPFFTQLWDGIKQTFSGVVQFFSSLFSGDFAGMKAGFEATMNGLSTAASAAWDIIKNVFSIAVTGLDNLITNNLPAGWVQVWEQVKASCSEFIGWLTAWAGSAVEAVKQGWSGLVGFFTELWTQIRAPFDAFIAYVTEGIAKIQGTIDGVKSFFGMGGSPAANPPAAGAGAPAGPITPGGENNGFKPISPVGGSKGFVPTALGAKEQTVGGKITVEAAPGTTIKNVQSDNPAVPITPNRGMVVGRV